MYAGTDIKHIRRQHACLSGSARKVITAVLLLATCSQAANIQSLDATVSGSVSTNTSNVVTHWADQSGWANDAVPAVGSVLYPSSTRFACGDAGLDFRAGRKYLELFTATKSESWLSQTSGFGFCVLIAFKAEAIVNSWNDLFGNSSAVSSGFGLRYSNSGMMQGYLGGETINKSGSPVAAGDTIVYSFNYNSATNTYEFWDSKNDSITTGTVAADDFSTANPVTLGSTTNSSRYFNGLVGEVKVYNTALSARELFREQSAMTYRWTVGQPDTSSPAVPSGLIAVPYDTQVSLNWENNSELLLGGNNIYRASATGGPYTRIATECENSHYTDFDLTNGTTYHYVVTAVDIWSNESDNSNEASATPEPAVSRIGGDLDYGAYYGYQAWHTCPDEGTVFDRWTHWFEGGIPDAAHIHGDMWPDMSEYPDQDLFETQMQYPNGQTVKVYSAHKYSTIDLHVKWMKEYGLRGLFDQRQQNIIDRPDYREQSDIIAVHIRTACEKYGVKFCMMPCNNTKSESLNEGIVQRIINDWKHCVDTLRITESPQYMYQNGKPVIGFWGLGFDNRPMTTAEATEILDFFQNAPEHKYRVYVMGGVPDTWRKNPKVGWKLVFLRLDMISPWRTIFYDAYNPNKIQDMVNDLAYCQQHGLDYNPVVSPGASTYHLRDSAEMLNWKPRDGGHFLWKQVYEVCNMGSKFMYVAMFDEIDEGTAMYKLVPTRADCPVGAEQVPLNEDGYNLPSDWYLQVGREAQKMLDGTIPLTPILPLREN